MLFVLLFLLFVYDWVHPPAHPKFYYNYGTRASPLPTSIYVAMDKYFLIPLLGLGIFAYVNLLIDPVILRANANGFERSGLIRTRYYSWEDVECVTYEHLYRTDALIFKIKPGREKGTKFGRLIKQEFIPVVALSGSPEAAIKEIVALPKVHALFKRPA